MSAFIDFVKTLPTDTQLNLHAAKLAWNAALEVACDRSRSEKQGQSDAGAESINAAICAINCCVEN